MGRLGRARCFIIQEKTAGLKLPSDLLGIHSATFVHPSVGIWKETLGLTCALIAERVIKLGTRDKPDPDKVAESDAIRTFCKRVTGAWWQRILDKKDVSALSFFQIKPDTVFNSLSLSGSSYDKTGALVGFWENIMARIYAGESKVLYSWKGWHTLAGMTHISFHGFGEMDFKGEADAKSLTHGQGRFWKVDEANPAKTINTPMQLCRITDNTAVSTMTSGKEKKVRTLIRHILKTWSK